MPTVRLILALHNHQPVGNFDGVFEAAYRDSYRPFLDVLEDYPDIPFALHTSGPLMEWVVGRHPEYIERVRKLVESGRVEILGGPFSEPILTMVPHRDRVGQIRRYADLLDDLFGRRPRGIWVPERVWEQQLVTALAEAEVEYTVLDDFHFGRAGVGEADLFGYYLTEDEGRLAKVFPISERLRYAIPFREPHETYEYLRGLSHERPGCTVVFADDGEKLGAWPKTFDHVYTHGWLRRFCDMIVGNRDWIEPTTFGRAVDTTLPLGKVYLPDSSYREMTEWALPADRLNAFEEAVRRLPQDESSQGLRPFLRAGGSWRNFKAKYAETDEMYARMLGVSERLAKGDPDRSAAARDELYRGQCNCPYWHGAFGGLYLPHLRNAIYRHLIAADNELDRAEGRGGPRAAVEVGDFNLDARQEVRLENEHLVAFVRPARGGHVYELDVRRTLTNVLATLDRRPESYHSAIAAATGDNPAPHIQDGVIWKQAGLDRLLVYDRHPRKALVDHFYPLDLSLDDLALCRDVERGDFASGTYRAEVERDGDRVRLRMERPGLADGHAIRVRKVIELVAGESTLSVDYRLEDLPSEVELRFAVEINLAAMAGRADDRYYSRPSGEKLGPLDTRLDLEAAEGLDLTDEWLDLKVGLRWSRPAALLAFPIETVSQSESGYEGVYQSSAVLPHWVVRGDGSGAWEVRIQWRLEAVGRVQHAVFER